jgi:hypothetical protein
LVKRLLALPCALASVALLPAPALAAPVIVGPTNVKAGTTVEFSAAPDDPAFTWDLNGDGIFGDQTGSPVTWAFSTQGRFVVSVMGSDGQTASQQVQVSGVSAVFGVFPSAPVAGEPVKFLYTASDATSAIEWDLDADAVFGDVHGPVATRTFPVAGTYAVSLRVSDIQDPPARTTSTRLIAVAAPGSPVASRGRTQLRLMSPFPVVRITGKVFRKGARIKHLTIRAPYGATVKVRCRGRGCPFHRSSKTLALAGKAKTPSKTISIKRLEHRMLRGGASIKVLVTRQGEIGKYTRFLIRRGKPPRRTDLCLTPGSTEPVECPSS